MKKLLIILMASVFATYGIISCSKKDSSSGGTTTSSYQGAGSKWTIGITGSDFTLNKFNSAGDSTAAITITGTATKYSNQFMKLTVGTVTGTGGPSVGDVAYGLEIPGYAFFLKPAGPNSEPIVMVQSGSCPSTGFDANWIIAKPKSTFTPPMTASSDFFGAVTMTMNGANSTLNVSQNEPITGAYLTTGGGNGNGTSTLTFDIGTCSSGLMRLAESGSYFDMYFTSSGGALVKFPDGQIIFGSPKQTTAVTQATLTGDYSGLVFEDKSSGDSVIPVKLVIPASGNSTGSEISDVAVDTLGSGGVVFSNISTTVDSTATQLPLGFFRADLNSSGSTTNGKVTCAYSTISGTKIVSCTGFMNNTGGEARRPFFLLARSR